MSDELPPDQRVIPEPSPGYWQRLAEMDPTVRRMLADGVPMTRENYIDRRYMPDGPPEPWNDEAEMDLPHPFSAWGV